MWLTEQVSITGRGDYYGRKPRRSITTMNSVFVLDTTLKPLTPCHPARARALLRQGKAAVYRRVPFTLVLKEAKPEAVVKPLTLKIDPGSKTTGIALVDTAGRVLYGAELAHRGHAIKAALDARRSLRRGRRSRHTRYRAARFANRRRPEGWLPPSLQHRVETTLTWVNRLRRWCAIAALAVERVKFDMQRLRNPEISGVEYQQGTLMGYEVREYLLEKWGRQCAYCGIGQVPLQIEHILARANGGSDAMTNLTLACECCNQKKGTQPVDVFLRHRPEVLKKILAHAKAPLKDAAAVNATHNQLFAALVRTGLPVETGTGAQTKFNRTRQDYPKTHWIDAACVGDSGSEVKLNPELKPLLIKCTGRGTRQTVRTDRFGFPRGGAGRVKRVHGFQTGDWVKLVQPKGKYAGEYVGRLAGIRADGRFDIATALGKITARFSNFTLLQRADGYAYAH